MRTKIVKLPRLLDAEMGERERLRPKTLTIDKVITPLSSASMAMPSECDARERDFIELYTANGSAGIYRVTGKRYGYGKGDQLTLEHGICTLDDAVYPGEGTIKGTVRSVLETIFARQTTKAGGAALWKLGDVDADDQIEIDNSGSKLLELLTRALEEILDYMPVYDQSTLPWVMHIRKKPDEFACEGRLSRNIKTISKTTDDSDLCTRLYCSLLDGGYMESDTIGVWGEVEKSISLNDNTPKEQVKAYCRRYLENRKNPSVSIEMEADEFYAMTGEALDRFEIGDICRIALPEYQTAIDERIVGISYQNAIGRPERVIVSLANNRADMSIKQADNERETSSLRGSSVGHGNAIRATAANLTNLTDSHEEWVETTKGLTHRLNTVEIDLNAAEAAILLRATQVEVDQLNASMKEAYIRLDAANAQIELRAYIKDLEGLENDVSIKLDAKANVIELNALKTIVNELEADLIDTKLGYADYISTAALKATSMDAGNAQIGTLNVTSLKVNGHSIDRQEKKVVTSVTRKERFAMAPSGTTSMSFYECSSVDTDTIEYLDWD